MGGKLGSPWWPEVHAQVFQFAGAKIVNPTMDGDVFSFLPCVLDDASRNDVRNLLLDGLDRLGNIKGGLMINLDQK